MNENRCVCCGEVIPEGTMVCWKCEKEANKEDKNDEDKITVEHCLL